MPFSQPGSCACTLYLHILGNRRKLHQKSKNIFCQEREMYTVQKQDASAAIAVYEKMLENVNKKKIKILKTKGLYSPFKIEFFISVSFNDISIRLSVCLLYIITCYERTCCSLGASSDHLLLCTA